MPTSKFSTSQKGNIALIPLIILLILAGVVIFFLIYKGVIQNPFQKNSPNSNLGAQIFKKTQNPLDGKIPETNPLAATKINPFKNIYPNPFDRTSK